MAERLTIQEVIEHCERAVIQAEMLRFTDTKQYMEHKQVREWLEELQHYKDLEEQGRLIKLPCKIGDTVYVVEDWGYRKELKEREIGVITLKGINDFSKEFWEDVYGGVLGNFSDIGKTVFLTKVEAEAALKS